MSDYSLASWEHEITYSWNPHVLLAVIPGHVKGDAIIIIDAFNNAVITLKQSNCVIS
jgi:hypothetical protein